MSYIYAVFNNEVCRHRFKDLQDIGEYYTGEEWKPSFPPALQECLSKGTWKIVSEAEAIASNPEAFKEYKTRYFYATNDIHLFRFLGNDDYGEIYTERWQECSRTLPMIEHIKQYKMKTLSLEQAIEQFPEAFLSKEEIESLTSKHLLAQ